MIAGRLEVTDTQIESPLGKASPVVKLGIAFVWLVGLALTLSPWPPLALAAIAIATGLLFLAMALLRMGWISRFLSKAVVTGFLAGAAVDVVIGELPKLTGTEAEGKNSWRELGSWLGSLGDVSGTTVGYPIIADDSRQVSEAYDMIHPGEGDTSTVRSVFLIDPDNTVRLTITYPKSVGRNFTEILRALDAVQATDGVPIATPANWAPGQDVIVALTLNDEDAKARFGDLDIKLPYLRFAKQPKTA